MKVILLGAGASKAYSESPTGASMPVAKDFFKTYQQLTIAENPWVLIGNLIRYVDIYHGVSVFDFQNYNVDIEQLHSEIEDKMTTELASATADSGFSENLYLYFKAYTELIFLFTSVLNEIQNGPPSGVHLKLAQSLGPQDTILTFNWDTLMDRALSLTGDWNCFNGYHVSPVAVYQDCWNSVSAGVSPLKKSPSILKLHGSTNWLTAAPIISHGQYETTQGIALDNFCVYESTESPYPTYGGRYMAGYENFSYGYYPVNLGIESKQVPEGFSLIRIIQSEPFRPKGKGPSHGLVSIPLIIPPVKKKKYEYFGNLFKAIWEKAEQSLVMADVIVLIGYSFPVTDQQSDHLFRKAFSKRSDMPRIIIVNPESEKIKERFVFDYGIREDRLTAYTEYFSDSFDFNKLI